MLARATASPKVISRPMICSRVNFHPDESKRSHTQIKLDPECGPCSLFTNVERCLITKYRYGILGNKKIWQHAAEQKGLFEGGLTSFNGPLNSSEYVVYELQILFLGNGNINQEVRAYVFPLFCGGNSVAPAYKFGQLSDTPRRPR